MLSKLFSFVLLFSILFLANCTEKGGVNQSDNSERLIDSGTYKISREVYYDKILGLLIGSAIGDAMGAPTEMWSRKDIRLHYGFVNSLDTMVRAPSGEGVWMYNLPAGGTTDDTRWKELMVRFYNAHNSSSVNSQNFAAFVFDSYKKGVENLKSTTGYESEAIESAMLEINWLQEWAPVAKSYAESSASYEQSLHKFYGGEMTCAGMLYSPIIGAMSPARPSEAYDLGYKMAIFDIGYSRDMTALISAMTAESFNSKSSSQTLLNVIRDVDPQQYFKSRLVGRTSYDVYQKALNICAEARDITFIDHESKTESQLDSLQRIKAYTLLDRLNQDKPFHPNEIFLVTLTAMIYADFHFSKTMEFIINYGRDNDTSAAVAGAILGAHYGAGKLPVEDSEMVLKVNKELLNIDLIELANSMTDSYFR